MNWKIDGKEVPLTELNDDHLINAMRWLIREMTKCVQNHNDQRLDWTVQSYEEMLVEALGRGVRIIPMIPDVVNDYLDTM